MSGYYTLHLHLNVVVLNARVIITAIMDNICLRINAQRRRAYIKNENANQKQNCNLKGNNHQFFRLNFVSQNCLWQQRGLKHSLSFLNNMQVTTELSLFLSSKIFIIVDLVLKIARQLLRY